MRSPLLDRLNDHDEWIDFVERRKSRLPEPDADTKRLEKYAYNYRYVDIARDISSGNYAFTTPRRKYVNKMGTKKKREVFVFNGDEMMALKLVAHLLYEYDHLFSPNLYSFRRDIGVKDAIRDLLRTPGLGSMHGYKVDIRDYFNSIDVAKLLPMLRSGFDDDPGLYSLFEGMLTNPLAECGGVFHVARKGAMAGTPTSPFLANLYLSGLDLHFHGMGVPYFRYADDLIVFARDEAELEGHVETMHGWFGDMGLEINPRKEYRFMPGEPVDFLGFSVHGGTVDLNAAAVRKMKMKIRRSGRSLRRWMVRTGATADAAMGVMLRKYNNKFFGREGGELSWAYWYFPTITTDASLREIDAHLQQWTRYVATGRHSGKNYETVTYERLKACGYRSLVN